jgi:hypothetical protein
MKTSIKKLVINVAAFGFVIGGFAQVSFAAESTSTITGGTLSITQPTIGSFADVILDGSVQTTTATVGSFTVTDATGTGNGWNVVVKASQFSDSINSLTLPTDSLSIALPTVTAKDGADLASTVTPNMGTIDNGTGVKILSAALEGGMGAYDIAYASDALTLNLLPKDVKAGTYTSTITVTVTTGP